jgi:hypothetical protein
MLTSSDASANAIGSATSTLPEHRSALFDGNAFAQAIDRAIATLPERRSAPLDDAGGARQPSRPIGVCSPGSGYVP